MIRHEIYNGHFRFFDEHGRWIGTWDDHDRLVFRPRNGQEVTVGRYGPREVLPIGVRHLADYLQRDDLAHELLHTADDLDADEAVALDDTIEGLMILGRIEDAVAKALARITEA
jgi:hypothetical protein